MKKPFLIACLVTTVTNLLLHAAAYAVILKDFFGSHPAGSEDFMKQLQRSPDQLIVWAMVVTSVTMGVFIALMIRWSGARTFTSGLKYGSIIGLLFWGSVNSGLYASSNHFSQASAFVDFASSATVMAISGAVAAWILGRGNEQQNIPTHVG